MQTAAYFREKAAEFRDLAKACDPETARSLTLLAEEYETEARRLQPDAEPPLPAQ